MCMFLLLKTHHFADVFPYNVKFEVDNGPFFYLAEIGMVVCVRNDGNLETVVF